MFYEMVNSGSFQTSKAGGNGVTSQRPKSRHADDMAHELNEISLNSTDYNSTAPADFAIVGIGIGTLELAVAQWRSELI
jgi:hypothetical protein